MTTEKCRRGISASGHSGGRVSRARRGPAAEMPLLRAGLVRNEVVMFLKQEIFRSGKVEYDPLLSTTLGLRGAFISWKIGP